MKKYKDPGLSFFGDVSLKMACLAWTPVTRYKTDDFFVQNFCRGRIMIIPKLNDNNNWWNYFGVSDSSCAVFYDWQNMTKKERLLNLYIEVWHAICRDGIDPKAAHEACLVIPEYRETLSGEWMFGEKLPDKYFQ